MNARLLLAIPAIVTFVTAAEPPGYQYPFTKGALEKVNVAGQKLVITTPRGPQTFELTERTYLFRGQQKLTLENLKTGDFVKINYYTNETGHAFIRRLKVSPPESTQ